MTIYILLLAVILGLLIGSFLNVCISRIPAGLSIVRPRSRCPECGKLINAYDNIPIISFVLLKGRCRGCAWPIPLRYPLVEFVTAVVTGLFVMRWGWNLKWLFVALPSAYLFIVISVIDFETLMIADIFSYMLGALGLVGAFFNPYFYGGVWMRLLSSVGGAAFGAALIWLMSVVGRKIYAKDAVGDGDIFLMAAIGSLIGWQGVVSSLVMASFFGSVYGLWLVFSKKAGRADSIPFGPFLSLGAVINIYSLVKLKDFLLW